ESAALDEYQGSSVYANDVGATARWTPYITQAGTYDVYTWWASAAPYGGMYDRDSSADYTIQYAGGSATVVVDQDTDSGQWVRLGTFSFAAGSAGYIELVRNCGNGVASSAGAVRLGGAGGAPGSVRGVGGGAGCSTGGGQWKSCASTA